MEITRLPTLSESDTGEAMRELKGYLVRLDRQLSMLLTSIGEEELAPALRTRIYEQTDERLDSMRNEIIGTAEEIREVSDRLELKLESEYVAKGQLGEYTEQAFQNIKIDGKGVTQYFEEIQALSERVGIAEGDISAGGMRDDALLSEVTKLNAYIKTGKLEDGVYGIEIGNFSEGGAPYKVRLSENRLSFFVNGDEAAYFSGNSMYISRASVPLVLTVGGCVMKAENGLSIIAE